MLLTSDTLPSKQTFKTLNNNLQLHIIIIIPNENDSLIAYEAILFYGFVILNSN